MAAPYLFDEFFASGKEESISPFLTGSSRSWAKNLSLKSASTSACFLVFAFGFSFGHETLSNICLTLVFFLSGTPALIDALDDLKNLEVNIDVLMTLAAFLAVMLGSSLEGALLLVLFEISGALEDTVAKKAVGSLTHLNNLSPKFALVLDKEGNTYEKAVRDIQVGTHLFVKAGEIVALDGKVVKGISSVNLVHLTGESIPDPKEVGDEVPAGARNLDAALTIEVTRSSSDSTLSRIVHLITEAQEAKPRLQRFLDSFGKTYAATIILLTVFFALVLPFFLSIEYLGIEGSIYRALAFLIAASPCALIIAVPTAYLSAISSCARKGILLKGGATLDALAACKTIAFDKTGTLTTGNLVCTAITPFGKSSYSELEILGIAAALERHVVHPIASSIVRLAQEKNAPLYEVANFKSTPGYGLEGTINGLSVAIGLPEKIAKHLLREKSGAQVLAALSIGEELYLFQFTDDVRLEVPNLIRKLQEENRLNSVMLTGDNEKNAKHVGKALGISHIFANLRPQDKLAKVAELALNGGLAMIGDGINDAPALARATVGISMGKIGSATAVDASDVVLLNDDLHLLSFLFSRATFCMRIVKQNLALALSVICFATIPALFGLIPLYLAVILHEGGTVLVGLNSLRLLRK